MVGCSDCNAPVLNKYGRVLWIVLFINLLMFLVEIVASWFSGSIAVFADSIDFLGDAGNYGASLIALRFSERWRSRVAMAKSIVMGIYGIVIILLAGILILVIHQRWPDIVVAMVIGLLGLKVSYTVITHAYQELIASK